jgi:hypothetical protein
MQECEPDAMARSPLGAHSSGECRTVLLAAGGLAALVLLLFADLLFASDIHMPSHSQGDTARYLVYSRLFGYAELRTGNLALWNPHTFSGAPFVGVFQTAMLYPPNLLYLLMPVRVGISVEMALHALLLGLGTFVWLRGKRVQPLSAFLACASVIFGATWSLRLLAGQLSVLDTYAWFPWLLLTVDRLEARITTGWVLVGVGATTMMILAGHPPSVLMAALAVALYAVRGIWNSRSRLRLISAYACIAVAPLLLSAVQLWPGLETASEGLRQRGMSIDFATSHSFPPERLLTLISPLAFGDASRFFFGHSGRGFYWDATLYIGVVPLLLGLHGAINARGRERNCALAMAAVLCLLAMGRHTPLYQLLFYAVPGFEFIRAPSKFLFFATLFGALLVGLGLDHLREVGTRRGWTAGLAFALGALLAVLSVWIWLAPLDPASSGNPIGLLMAFRGVDDVGAAGQLVSWRGSLLQSSVLGAVVAISTAGLVALQPRFGRPQLASVLIVALAVAELWVFARTNRGTTRVTADLDLRPSVSEAYRRAGNARVLETGAPSNVALARRNFGLWGYDPVILRRYAHFMAFTQGRDFDRIKDPTFLHPRRFHPLHGMLRGRFEVGSADAPIIEHPGALSRFELISRYRVEPDPEKALRAMASDGFDFHREVVLEEEPPIEPVTRAGDGSLSRVFVIEQSTDHVDLEVETRSASLLVVTDNWSRGWRAIALEGSVQGEYVLQPANVVLRAVALAAGRHRLRIEYAPVSYHAGRWASSIAGGVYLACVALHFATRQRRHAGEAPATSPPGAAERQG